MWLVLALLACTTEADPLASLRDHDRALAAEVEALRSAEATLLERTAREALEAGDLGGAVQSSALLDPPPATILDAIAGAAGGLSLADRARVLAALAALDPARADAAEAAAIALRYGPARDDTLARYRGVRPELGIAALALVEANLLPPVDWSALVAAGDRRLARIPGATALPPQEVSGRAGAEARLRRQVAEAGLPVEVAVAEWIEAGLAAVDPHGLAVWPADLGGWEEHHAGVYVGVGLELADDDAGPVVRWPVPGSPAFAAGLHQGDRIVTVDERAVASAAEAAALLRGEEGTEVVVAALRDGAPQSFTVARAPVVPDTVVGWQRAADNTWDPWLDRDAGLAYARVLAFRPHTDEALDALLEPVASEARGLILDLRGCPGGDLNAAVQLVDRFVVTGTIARLDGREPPPEPPPGVVPWNEAVEGHALEDLAVAVLIDGSTASSAEVVAGALDALDEAVLVGETSYGKGSSQVLLPVEALGFAVQLTNYRWVLPDGRSLADAGVSPDEALPLGAAGAYQVDLARRRREHVRTHADGSPLTPDLPAPREDLPALSDDPHVVRAALRLRERLAGER